jgi:hypothetical protein
MIFSENRFPLFGIMLSWPDRGGGQRQPCRHASSRTDKNNNASAAVQDIVIVPADEECIVPVLKM